MAGTTGEMFCVNNVSQTIKIFFCLHFSPSVLLQHGADPNIRNTDGKSALDLADPSAKAVLTGQSLSAAYLPCLHVRHLTCSPMQSDI